MTNQNPAMIGPSLTRRLAAMLYDALLLFGLWTLVSALALLATAGRLADPDRPMLLIWGVRAALLATTIGFFAWFWTHGGQTLGMRAWRLRLVAEDGSPVSLGQALRRMALAVVSLLPLGLGYLWVLTDSRRLAWHDRLSHTRLVVLPRKS